LRGPLVCLTSDIAKSLIGGEREVSLDLGISEDRVKVEDDQVTFPSGDSMDVSMLNKVSRRDNVVFVLLDSHPVPVEVRNRHYMKLVPTGTAPVLEIDGVRMHRTKNTTPEKDADSKVAALNISGGRLLEIGTGLGYTTKAAARKELTCVVSLELDPNVLQIARINPWSQGLFEDPLINIILADSCRLVLGLPKESFDYILHDPPTLARAGDLYSEVFYGQLHSVLRTGGRLFHYTGLPGATSRGLNVAAAVAGRLRRVGFSNVRIDHRNRGVLCEKDSSFP